MLCVVCPRQLTFVRLTMKPCILSCYDFSHNIGALIIVILFLPPVEYGVKTFRRGASDIRLTVCTTIKAVLCKLCPARVKAVLSLPSNFQHVIIYTAINVGVRICNDQITQC